ncbi:hypothetical protein PAXRUDRAFT_824724 [Paxillus rubicundulus Ve08.2h10]|uniref:Unplaced genomic scaffold scaffold_104, whole genome shotgun sequence n=1 Tax=Paxillus rubicundulus Ve08.2h10 TaxID=930991 RepID=A0A0D0E7F1_9AGAM|nr:hypothetical protein PAXRUDRAFT_824724 [Paxillus rubicundulus Ve08.2h10]
MSQLEGPKHSLGSCTPRLERIDIRRNGVCLKRFSNSIQERGVSGICERVCATRRDGMQSAQPEFRLTERSTG